MAVRRAIVAVFGALVVLACGCAILVAAADARSVRVFEKQFGGAGSGTGQFDVPVGVAVNDETNDVYVVDSGNDRVEEFDSTGAFVGEFNGSGSPTGVFSDPTQIAIDNSGNPLDPSAGDVYVADFNHHVIDKFSANGSYIGQLTGTTCETPPNNEEVLLCPKTGTVHPFGELVGLAVDGNGMLWTDAINGPVDSFNDALSNEPLSTRVTIFGRFGIRPGLAVAEGGIYMAWGPAAKVDNSGRPLVSPFCGAEKEEVSGLALDSGLGLVFVDKRSSVSVCGLGGGAVESFGSGHVVASGGVAVDGSSGAVSSNAVYVSDKSANDVVIFASEALPTVAVAGLSGQTPRGVTLNGTVNPEGHAVTACFFEYDTTPYLSEGEAAHGTKVACSPASVGSGTAPVHVEAGVSGLEPQHAYYCRLVAENAASAVAGPGRSPGSRFFTGPIVGGAYATGVTSASATISASLDPNGGDTHYYFEYGTSASYGSFAPVEPPGIDAGSVSGARTVSARLQGLRAGVAYHYRLVAEQDGESFEDGDESFMTQAAVAGGASPLPDGRMWELVSPAVKSGVSIEFLPGFSDNIQAAADGSGIYYRTLNQLGEGPVGKGVSSYVLSSRDGSGWGSRDLTLPDVLPPEGDEPANDLGGSEYLLFSPDLSAGVVEPHRFTPPLAPGVSERTVYLRDLSPVSSFVPLVTSENTPPGTQIGVEQGVMPNGRLFNEPLNVYAATPDLRSLVLRSPVALDEYGYSEYYEWRAGALSPVGVLPDDTRYEGLMALAGNEGSAGAVQRAMSGDGRWIAWTAGESPYLTPHAPLYVRDMVGEKTLKVGGTHPRYQTMSSDGSKVFYLENGDMYLFETGTESTTDLTAVHGVGEASAGVREVVSDVSEDGSYVYFVATGVLANGAERGQPNLYVSHDGEGGWSEPVLVATLSWEDEPSWYAYAFNAGTSAPGLAYVSSRVSPNGRYLAFMSERSLTGYDNRDASSGQPDEEVYLYDARSNGLVCVSCNPTGARPNGVLDKRNGEPLVDRKGSWSGRHGGHEHWLAGSVPGWDEGVNSRSMYQPRYLSDSGRLFFDSPDALVPQATNGLEDVYEYEPPGVGRCVVGGLGFNERTMGCVSLISAGISGKESAFFDAGENGNDVFFITAAKLAGADRDTAYDVYDAHVCGGERVPCQQEPVSPPACTNEESCRAAPSPQPTIFGAPPSATFSGAGNLPPAEPPVVAQSAPATPRRITRAQQLTRALRACHAKRGRGRAACERTARKRYGPSTAARRAGKASAPHGKGGR